MGRLIAPPAGTIGISTIEGHTGAFVKFGQRFMGATQEDAEWSHTFFVGYHGDVYQAMPSGMECVSIESYLAELEAGDKVKFVAIPELTEIDIERAVHYANVLVEEKRGYSWGTYLALFLRRIGFGAKWLRKAIASRKTLICSQAVDQIITQGAGYQLFRDGRSPLDVMPADYIVLLRESGRLREFELQEVM